MMVRGEVQVEELVDIEIHTQQKLQVVEELVKQN